MLRLGPATLRESVVKVSRVKDSTITPWIASTGLEHLGRCPVTMGLVGTLSIVESEVVTETSPALSPILVCFQIHWPFPRK